MEDWECGVIEDRRAEISMTINLIQSLCESTKICLIAKNNKGLLHVAILDATNGKEYVLVKNKGDVVE